MTTVKILLVTARLAYPILAEVVKGIEGVQVDIMKMDVPVAALMDVRYLADRLKGVKGYDYIVLPGLVFGDGKVVERATGIPTVKGTEEAWDVKLVIDALLNGKALSPLEPADKFVYKSGDEEQLKEIEAKMKEAFTIAGVKIPLRPPPFRIFLEVSDKQTLEDLRRVINFIDVIVVGLPVGHNDREEVRRKVKEALDLGKPVGIDSDSPQELIEGVRAGASFVFNMNERNLDLLLPIRNEASFIIAPYEVTNRGDIVVDTLKRARAFGFDKLILDPVLSPPLKGFVDSLKYYAQLKETVEDVPIMMGILNFTELIDADSIGVNASMVTIAGEVGASCLLTMDKGKTRWSAWEVQEASKMVSVAMSRSKLPKDLGIDLLILKEKRRIPREQPRGTYVERNEPSMDKGFTRIYLSEHEIVLEWKGGGEEVVLHGNDALSIGRQLIRELGKRGISPSLEHSIYIGYELSKAEIALSIDKNYIQDKPLFKKIPSGDNIDTNLHRKQTR